MESDRQPENVNLPGLESLGLHSFLHLPQDTDTDPATHGNTAESPPTSINLHHPPLSNQRYQLKKQRRLQSSVSPSAGSRRGRSYLKSQKYLEYRARRRRDTGKDGQPVWSDELEDAFQQALEAHPPMGSRKRSEHGKPYGRNELIAEFIHQKTGQRRTRKQVSSHLQLLDSFLKGDPDWERLVREQPTDRVDGLAQPLGSGGRSWKDNELSSHYSDHNHAVQCLGFDMWVSAPNTPDRIEDAFHVYTRLQGVQRSPSMPLENIVGWRTSFPRLNSLLSDVKGPLDCEMILLEANLELMDEFPPVGSRLGIHLELDIGNSTSGATSMSGTTPMSNQIKDWTCSTYIYENGQITIQTEHDLPQPRTTKIRPPFESSWWAKIFTQLTQQKKETENIEQYRADEDCTSPTHEEEEAETPEQYHINEDCTRQYFRTLSAVQEIRAREPVGLRRMHNQYSSSLSHGSRRMAIILWKFRQTRPGAIGTTTWRKLTTSSYVAVDLPPLSLDPPKPLPIPVYPDPDAAQVGINGGLSGDVDMDRARLELPLDNEFGMGPYAPDIVYWDLDESMDLSTENSRAADVVLGLTQTGAITDSGYASTCLDKHKYVQSTGDGELEIPTVPEYDSTEHLETSQTQVSLEMAAAQTVYSDTSSIAPLRKESYISLFGEDLFTELVAWQPDAQAIERISEVLPELLRAFALKIGHNAPSQIHRDVMVFIHKNRDNIVSNFKERWSHEEEVLSDDGMGNSLGMPLDEKWDLWNKHLEEQQDPIPHSSSVNEPITANTHTQEEQEEQDEESDMPELSAYKNFISNVASYEWLLSSLRRELLLAPAKPNIMETTRKKILTSLPSSHRLSRSLSAEAYTVIYVIQWNPLDFLDEQGYQEEPGEAIKGAITLTGSAEDAQALSCAQYLCQTWPSTGGHILQIVMDIVRAGPGSRQTCDLPDNTKVAAWLNDSGFNVEAFGTRDSVAELGEQFAWLGAALRSSPYEVGIAYCTPTISDLQISMRNSPTDPLWPDCFGK